MTPPLCVFRVCVRVCAPAGVIGYGTEYLSALSAYRRQATVNPRVKVVELTGPGMTSRLIADMLLGMLNAPVTPSAWV